MNFCVDAWKYQGRWLFLVYEGKHPLLEKDAICKWSVKGKTKCYTFSSLTDEFSYEDAVRWAAKIHAGEMIEETFDEIIDREIEKNPPPWARKRTYPTRSGGLTNIEQVHAE